MVSVSSTGGTDFISWTGQWHFPRSIRTMSHILCTHPTCKGVPTKLSSLCVSLKFLFANGLSCSPGASPPSYHLNCLNIPIYMVICSPMATCPGRLVLNKPRTHFCSLHLEGCLWHGRWCSPCSSCSGRAADARAQHFQPASWVSSPFLCPFPMPPPTLGFGYVQLFGNLKLGHYKFDLNLLTLYPSMLSQIITVCRKFTSFPFLPNILKRFFFSVAVHPNS